MTKMIKILLLALAFTPLVVDNSVFFPFITGKSLFLRGILVLISVLFLLALFCIKKFREEIIRKTNLFIKNPLVISIFVFILLFIISTIFAIDKYSAFWGTLGRAEGLVGIMYFFSFFVFSLLVFEKKDWLWFFKLSLFTSLALLLKEFFQFFNGVSRPDSFMGNSTFLAGYLLFSIFCAIVVFKKTISLEITTCPPPLKHPSESGRGVYSRRLSPMGWKYFAIGIFILSVLGIFVTQTRGTIAGLALGIVAILVYGIVKGRNVVLGKLNLRTLSIIFLSLIIVFSVIFIPTRDNKIWQKVPGLSRIATIRKADSTMNTRLILAQISLNAVNPANNGLRKFLIGWGPENFSLAYGKYFNPEQFKYEIDWLDRAHNKFLDVLVMNGLLGLIAYLAIWFFLFKNILKKDISLINVGLLFFSVSYFVHLLFAFDQIATYIPFFTILSFVVFLIADDATNKKEDEKLKRAYEISKLKKIFVGMFLSFLVLFLCFVFFRNDLIGYSQIRKFHSLMEKGDINILSTKINSVFEPFTVAQADIRKYFLTFVMENKDLNNESVIKLTDVAIDKAEEYTKKEPFNLQYSLYFAIIYSSLGENSKNLEFLKKGEELCRKLIIFSPNRPDFNYDLALNLFYQKKYDESFDYFEKSFNLSPSFFQTRGRKVEITYEVFIKYFYEARERENFIKVVDRLRKNNYKNVQILDQIIEYLEKTNTWPKVNFKPA